MEHSQNRICMTWRCYLNMGALVVTFCWLLLTVAHASGDAKALKLRGNVVSIATEIVTQNDRLNAQGFGFIIGKRNGNAIIVTADHVVRGKNPRPDQREYIKVTYFNDQVRDYPANLLRTFKSMLDLAVIEAKLPGLVEWDTDVLGRSENIRRGTEVWYIGRSGKWHVPTTPGKINSEPLLGIFTIDDLSLLPGTSGAPVVSSIGIIGMLTTDSPGSESQAISFDTIKKLLKRWNLPCLLADAPSIGDSERLSTGRLYVNTIPTNAVVKIINSNLPFHQGIELSPGEYRVLVSAAGYEENEKLVPIKAEENKKIEVHLNRTLWIGGNQRFIFGGGPKGGTFSVFANGIQTYLPIQNLIGISVRAQSTGGSIENLRKTNAGRQQMSIVYSGHVWLGREGELKNDPTKYDNVMAVAWLYGVPAQLVVKKYSGISSVRDLSGRKVGVGNAGSGAFANCEHFFSYMGIWDRIERNAMGYNDAAAAFGNNQLDAFWLFTAYPSGAVVMAAQTNDINLINLGADAENSGFLQKYPCYTRTSIPAGTYRGVNHDTPTFQDSALWVANAQVPEAVVYNLLSVIYSDIGLRHIREQKKTFLNMSLTTGAKNIVTPFHPGAVKFWKDKGMLRN